MARRWKKNGGVLSLDRVGILRLLLFVLFQLFLGVLFFPNGLCGGHLHGDVGEESPPSGGVLLGLESGIGRGTGRATGGGGGSKKEPGILLWPLPFGCRQHKQGQGGRHATIRRQE